MNILVIGGTRFFGKELVLNLLSNGNKVTLVSRGNNLLPENKNLSHIKGDRSSLVSLLDNFPENYWEAAYDQICYSSQDAKITLQAVEGKAKKLIIASSEAVYSDGANMVESDFNPYKYPYEIGSRQDFSYADGKRNAESFLYQNTSMPVIAVRIPYVLGNEDYTQRFLKIVEAVCLEKHLHIPATNVNISMINSKDIGKALYAIKSFEFSKPINISPKKPILISEIIRKIEGYANKKALLTTDANKGLTSDFFTEKNRYMNTDLASKMELKVNEIDTWMDTLIQNYLINEL